LRFGGPIRELRRMSLEIRHSPRRRVLYQERVAYNDFTAKMHR